MVLIAVPHQGNIRVELSKLLSDLEQREDHEVHYSYSQPVDTNRNKIVNYFLEETEHDTLIMVDSDIIPPDNFTEILDYEFDIISPVVFSTREGVPYPVATDLGEDGSYRMHDGEFGELIDVEGVGTGCIAIKREVLEDIDQPVFEFEMNQKGELDTSEDFNFCKKANNAGYSVKVATKYACGHITEVDLYKMMTTMSLAIDADKSNIYVEEAGENNEDEKR